jgi:hypothetical protein
MAVITVPRVLREKLGEDGADSLIELINKTDASVKEDVLVFVEEKFERRLAEELGKVNERISEEIGKVNERISQEIGKVNVRISEETGTVNERISETKISLLRRIEEVNTGLLGKIAETKTEMIRWMFIFWVGQIAVMVGILLTFLRK